MASRPRVPSADDHNLIAELCRHLLENDFAEEIVLAVRQALLGKGYLSKSMSRAAIDNLRWQHKKPVYEDERLTDRQREVLLLLAEGKIMKEVGGILNMSMSTVAYHKYRIMDIIGARSNAELVKYAVRNKMVAA
jgi:DNA-binding NarL/FixJ family response regulator